MLVAGEASLLPMDADTGVSRRETPIECALSGRRVCAGRGDDILLLDQVGCATIILSCRVQHRSLDERWSPDSEAVF